MSDERRLWFYVPDYPLVEERLWEAYIRYSVDERSAEPTHATHDDTDADVVVTGSEEDVSDFRDWLCRTSHIVGLQVEGESVLAGPSEPG